MALLIDTPRWPAHDRLWAHLVSDASLAELHDFAARVGLPARSFEGDHYDVPAEHHAAVVAAGARLVEGRVVVQALQRSGLRLPKRRGERVLGSWDQPGWGLALGARRVDCVASTLPPVGTELARWVLALDDEGRLALDGARLPPAVATDARHGFLRLRGDRTTPWRHVAVHHRPGPVDGLVHVAPSRVRDVEAQDLWWPLLDALRAPRGGAAR